MLFLLCYRFDHIFVFANSFGKRLLTRYLKNNSDERWKIRGTKPECPASPVLRENKVSTIITFLCLHYGSSDHFIRDIYRTKIFLVNVYWQIMMFLYVHSKSDNNDGQLDVATKFSSIMLNARFGRKNVFSLRKPDDLPWSRPEAVEMKPHRRVERRTRPRQKLRAVTYTRYRVSTPHRPIRRSNLTSFWKFSNQPVSVCRICMQPDVDLPVEITWKIFVPLLSFMWRMCYSTVNREVQKYFNQDWSLTLSMNPTFHL